MRFVLVVVGFRGYFKSKKKTKSYLYWGEPLDTGHTRYDRKKDKFVYVPSAALMISHTRWPMTTDQIRPGAHYLWIAIFTLLRASGSTAAIKLGCEPFQLQQQFLFLDQCIWMNKIIQILCNIGLLLHKRKGRPPKQQNRRCFFLLLPFSARNQRFGNAMAKCHDLAI